jgi:ABC-type sugar transport system, auxiliary component
MKRSEINRFVEEAAEFFAANHFALPAFAGWSPAEWKDRHDDVAELRSCKLGWDVTDFNSGNFPARGLTLFTLRNGPPDGSGKAYAEKIMYVRENQVTPYHYHVRKTEDIINRGNGSAGRLLVQLYNRGTEGGLEKTAVTVMCDGIARSLDAGGTVLLGPGESITLTPYLYHQFYAIDGDALIGEVSSVNDDATDNYFLEPLPRFPQIHEDELPVRLLCTEY